MAPFGPRVKWLFILFKYLPKIDESLHLPIFPTPVHQDEGGRQDQTYGLEFLADAGCAVAVVGAVGVFCRLCVGVSERVLGLALWQWFLLV